MKSISERYGFTIPRDWVTVIDRLGCLRLCTREAYEYGAAVCKGMIITGADGLLTVEGAQAIGPLATKNIIDISEAQLDGLFTGRDLELDAEDGDHILRCGKLFIAGCRVASGKAKNPLPQWRLIRPVA